MNHRPFVPRSLFHARLLFIAGLLAPTFLLIGCDKAVPSSADNQPRGYVKRVLPKPTPELVKARLTNPPEGVVPHVLAPASEFVQRAWAETQANAIPRGVRPRSAQELIPKSGITVIDGRIEEKDWSGITLVPKNLSTSLVYTTKVSIQYLEVHPLQNGSVRIWARLKNLQGAECKIEIGCSFRTNENLDGSTVAFYQIAIPEDYIDIFFVSPRENIVSYTFLVRDARPQGEHGDSRDDNP
jgi:hypothetical protein